MIAAKPMDLQTQTDPLGHIKSQVITLGIAPRTAIAQERRPS